MQKYSNSIDRRQKRVKQIYQLPNGYDDVDGAVDHDTSRLISAVAKSVAMVEFTITREELWTRMARAVEKVNELLRKTVKILVQLLCVPNSIRDPSQLVWLVKKFSKPSVKRTHCRLRQWGGNRLSPARIFHAC